MVPPTSRRIPRVRRYSGYCRSFFRFVYMTLTFSGGLSHALRLRPNVTCAVLYPGCITTPGLASSAFARHYSRNLGWFLFLSLLRCFSSGGSPRMTIWFTIRYILLLYVCSHIRISAALCLFAAPRSFSQLVTSFFGSWCQGIPLTLFLAWTPLYIFRYTRSLYRLNCCVSRFYSCFSISLWQNCFFYPLERPDFLIYFKISSFSLFA